jgi:hypothetical protein
MTVASGRPDSHEIGMLRDQPNDLPISASARTFAAPRGDDNAARRNYTPDGINNDLVRARANRVWYAVDQVVTRVHKREQVTDFQPAMSPAFSERAAPRQSPAVATLVADARVQHDEQNGRSTAPASR